jgi:hypothetical protein
VLLLALDLIAHRQVGHAVASQAKTVNVAGGVFGGGEGGCPAGEFGVAWTLAGRCLVMAGGGDEVAVTGEKIEAIQALKGTERVWQGPAHVDLDLGENLTEQGETPLALEAF